MPQPARPPNTGPESTGPERTAAFVGRSGELAVLRAALRQAAAGDGRLVLVAASRASGDRAGPRLRPGGRGRRRAGAVGQRVGGRRGAALLALGAGAARLGRQAGAEALALAAGPQAALLAPLLPELGGSGPGDGAPGGIRSGDGGSGDGGSGDGGAPAAGPGARFALFDAVCAVLDRASRSAPLVVVLDDLHAAGRPSALLVRFAATARLPRVLLVATYRTAEAALDPEVSDVVAALESVEPAARPDGPDLRRRAAPAARHGRRRARRRPAPRGREPAFRVQVARLLGYGAATVADVPVPAGIRQAVRRQVATLDGDGDGPAAEVLATAAALGPGIDPALVAAVLGTGPGPSPGSATGPPPSACSALAGT